MFSIRRIFLPLALSATILMTWATFPLWGQGMGSGHTQNTGHQDTMQHTPGMTPSGSMPGASGKPGKTMPTMPGQDAFGTIQEIVDILNADPETNWSKVRLGVLREHLVDMNLVTLEAQTKERKIPGGLEIQIKGKKRTKKAIQTMVMAHSQELDKIPHWKAKGTKIRSGARLVVTSTNKKEAARIRGLGFFGLMATGAHHQPHHMGMARGEMVHGQ